MTVQFFVSNFLLAVLIIMVAVALIALFFKATNTWSRSWLIFLMVSFVAGLVGWFVYPFSHRVDGLLWIPMVLLAIVLGGWISWSANRGGSKNYELPPTPEPYYTEEELRGLSGTREAVSIYFGLVLLVFGLGMLLRYLFSFVNY